MNGRPRRQGTTRRHFPIKPVFVLLVTRARSSILLRQNRFANCEVHHTQKLNFTLAMG